MEVVEHKIFTAVKGTPRKSNRKSYEALGLLKTVPARIR